MAKYFVQQDNEEWKGHTAGKLGIYQDKTTKKYKIVIRDKILGKVLFNVALVPKMTFRDVSINAKKTSGTIYFKAVRDTDVGHEMFCIRTINLMMLRICSRI